MNDQSILTEAGGYVTAIGDKSGNGYTFNASGGSTITAIDLEQNNKNILRFDNNSDATSYSNVVFDNTASKHKWYFVVRVTSSDSHDALFVTKSSPTSSGYFV